MLNFDKIQGIEVRKFCGMAVEQDGEYTIMCINTAVGEITVEDEGMSINIPVCQQHLEVLQEKYEVDNLDGTLLE